MSKINSFAIRLACDHTERRSALTACRFLGSMFWTGFFAWKVTFLCPSCQLINVVAAVTQQTMSPSVSAGPYILLKVRSICMDNATDPERRINQLKKEVSIFFNSFDKFNPTIPKQFDCARRLACWLILLSCRQTSLHWKAWRWMD